MYKAGEKLATSKDKEICRCWNLYNFNLKSTIGDMNVGILRPKTEPVK